MKKTIFAIAVLLLFIGLGIGEQIYLNKLLTTIFNDVVEIRELVENKDLDEALEKSKDVRAYWEDKQRLTEAIISHNETKELSSRLSELEGYLAAKDDKSAIATAAITVDLCNNLKHILGFKWDTVL